MVQPIVVEPISPFSNPTDLALSASASVPSTSRYIVTVAATGDYILTVPAGRSHLIQNQGAVAFRVGFTTGTITVPAGSEIQVAWSASKGEHETQLTTSTEYDDTVTTGSNAVKSSGIKTYVDTAVASASGTPQADTYAALRAYSTTPERIYVKGRAATYDGGHGMFVRLATSGGDTDDVDAGGDDDDGWHLVHTATGAVYGRDADVAYPEHFGAAGETTEAGAAAASDQSAAMQRFIDFVLDPAAFAGWDYRPDIATPDGVVPDLFYRCEETIHVEIPDGYPFQSAARPGNLDMRGAVWTPLGLNQPGMDYVIGRGKHKPECVFNCVKQNQGTNKVEWNNDNWPDLWRDPDAYYTWTSTTEVHAGEEIKQLLGDGSTMLYRVTVAGALGVSAPTHTTGSATNGAATLLALGTIRNTDGKSVHDMLRYCRDSAHALLRVLDTERLTFVAEGYTICVDATPRHSTGACGFNRFKIAPIQGCKFGVVHGTWQYDEGVANSTARLALTGCPIGFRVRQDDDTTNDYIFNGPLGGESTSGNWTTTPKVTADRWTNHNQWDMGLVNAQGSSGAYLFIDSNRSVYGFAQTRYNGTGSPTGNRFNDLTVEFASQTGNAELVQAYFDYGAETSGNCRNDQESLGTVAVFALHADQTQEAFRNKVEACRAGRWVVSPTYSTDVHNGGQNRVIQTPGRHDCIKTFEVDLLEDAVFSGADKVYFRKTTLTYRGTQSHKNWGPHRGPSYPTTRTLFNGATRSFNFTEHEMPTIAVDLPYNHRGSALIEVEIFNLNVNDESRVYVTPLHPITGAFINPTSRPRQPIAGHTSWALQAAVTGQYRYLSTGTPWNLPLQFGVLPWVRKILVQILGNNIVGYRVSAYEAPMAHIYSPASQLHKTGGADVVDAIPERGIYRAPTRLLLVDQDGANKWAYLDKAESATEWYATSGNTSGIGSPYLYQWGHDGAGTLKEYDGSTWQTLLSGVNTLDPSDWAVEA